MAAWPAGTYACSDVAYKTLTFEGDYPGPRYTEMEVMVATPLAPALVADVRALLAALAQSRNKTVALWCGVRYVQGDDIPLSPFYLRDSAVLSFIVFAEREGQAADARTVRDFHGGIEGLAVGRYGGRPHPGKNNYFTASQMAAAYPNSYAGFAALRGELDPGGVFDNAYLARLFPLTQ